MNISSQIIDSETSKTRLISSNTDADYHYVDGYVVIELDIDGVKHSATLQTGHFYDHNDYSMPSNTLCIYHDGSSDLLCKLDNEDDAEEINEYCETSYSSEEIQAISDALVEIIAEAQIIINDAEREAEEELENDSNFYVSLVPMEKYEVEEGVFDTRQCEAEELHVFSDEEDAEHYVSETNENTIDYARLISADEAHSRFPEQF